MATKGLWGVAPVSGHGYKVFKKGGMDMRR